MNVRDVIFDAAGKFDSPALAILTRCEQSGVQLPMDGEHLKAKGDRDTIAAWQPMIQRHKPEIIAALSGQNLSENSHEGMQTLAADYEELTACINKLCDLAGYSTEVRERMLAARCGLFPYQYASECAYFRLQVILAKAGTYWSSAEPSQPPSDAIPSPTENKCSQAHPGGRAA